MLQRYRITVLAFSTTQSHDIHIVARNVETLIAKLKEVRPSLNETYLDIEGNPTDNVDADWLTLSDDQWSIDIRQESSETGDFDDILKTVGNNPVQFERHNEVSFEYGERTEYWYAQSDEHTVGSNSYAGCFDELKKKYPTGTFFIERQI